MIPALGTLPNLLTIFRILVLPPLAVFILHGQGWAAFSLMVAAGISDFLDGWLARRWKLETPFGKLLDPVADKLLLCVGVVDLVARPDLPISPFLASVLLCREFFITGLRAMAASMGLVIAAENLGKIKMVFQFIGLGALFIGNVEIFNGFRCYELGLIAMWISVVLSYWSMTRYAYNAWMQLRHQLL